MTTKRLIHACAAAAAALLLAGCATFMSPEPDMEADWVSEVPVDFMATAYAVEDGERIVLGNRNDIYILDGETGAVVDRMEEDFWERHRPDAEIAGVSVEGAISDAYTLVPLEDPARMLLFEYQFEDETMMGIGTDSVEPLWIRGQHEYSLAKYSEFLDAATEAAAGAVAAMLGGSSQTRSDYEQRADEISFIENIVHDVPGESTFLIKTFDGLMSLESEDGTQNWKVPGFDGPGIADAVKLPGGDHVVLSTGRNIGNFEVSTDYSIARITESGDVVWMESHSGIGIEGLHVADGQSGGQVVVDGSPTEVFDLADGTKLWENEIDKRGRHHNLAVADGAVYIAGDLEPQAVRAGIGGWVWKHDAETGEILWQSEQTNTELTGLTRAGDLVLVRGEGDWFEGTGGGVAAFDAESGERLWETPQQVALGGFLGMQETSTYYGELTAKPVLHEGTVYVAGTEQLFAIDAESGNIEFQENHDELRGSGGVNGIFLHDDRLVLVGLEAVAAYDLESHELLYATEIEGATDYGVHGQRLIVRDDQRIGALNLETGSLGPMMRAENLVTTFGDFDDRFVLTNGGRHVLSIDNDSRRIERRTLF